MSISLKVSCGVLPCSSTLKLFFYQLIPDAHPYAVPQHTFQPVVSNYSIDLQMASSSRDMLQCVSTDKEIDTILSTVRAVPSD